MAEQKLLKLWGHRQKAKKKPGVGGGGRSEKGLPESGTTYLISSFQCQWPFLSMTCLFVFCLTVASIYSVACQLLLVFVLFCLFAVIVVLLLSLCVYVWREGVVGVQQGFRMWEEVAEGIRNQIIIIHSFSIIKTSHKPRFELKLHALKDQCSTGINIQVGVGGDHKQSWHQPSVAYLLCELRLLLIWPFPVHPGVGHLSSKWRWGLFEC